MSPSSMREMFFPRRRLEVEWRNLYGKNALFPNSLDGLATDMVIRFRGRECILLLLIVRTEDGSLIQEGLLGWLETGSQQRPREVRPVQQRVPVAELRSAQRHGGQSDEVAA